MKSMQILEWGKPLEMRDVETPVPQGKQILIAVEYCGVPQ
jgi:D-arabinose 1-dehydrogenase-like Zn-dependent alcohol dehydrogenase